MAAGQYGRGDIVTANSGNPTGQLRVVFATDFWTKDPRTGLPPAGGRQALRVRQLAPATVNGQQVIWTNRPDIVGGHLFELRDDEVTLVSTAAQTP